MVIVTVLVAAVIAVVVKIVAVILVVETTVVAVAAMTAHQVQTTLTFSFYRFDRSHSFLEHVSKLALPEEYKENDLKN